MQLCCFLRQAITDLGHGLPARVNGFVTALLLAFCLKLAILVALSQTASPEGGLRQIDIETTCAGVTLGKWCGEGRWSIFTCLRHASHLHLKPVPS